jgi:murein DD-endopeptidase MepM/ murein hydrolase activator NlpD
MANSLSALTQQVEKLLGLLKTVDVYAAGGGGAGAGGNVMPNSLGRVNSQAPSFWGTVGGSMRGMAVMAGGASQMMPNVAETLGREGSIYSAGVSSGAIMGRGRLENLISRGLGDFQSAPGMTGIVGAMLAGRGMVPGTAVFSRTAIEVGQANRYLNMNNPDAAGAFENFTAGPTSGMMMRNFGVFTSNPLTGEVLSQNEIFQQLKGRFLGGRQATVEGTMESLRRGNLGSNLRNSGLSGEQQAILSSQFIANAMGVNLDFSDPTSVDKLSAMMKEQGYENPFLSQYKLNSKDDALMEAAKDPYLAGVKDATGALIELKNFTESELIPTFGRLKATLDTFAGSPTGTGAVAGVLGGVAMGAALGRGVFGNARGVSAASKAGNQSAAMKGGLKTGGLLGAATAIPGVISAVEQGTPGAGIGNAIGSIAGGILGSILGTIINPGAGTVIGGLVGGQFGGMAGNAVGSMFDQSTNGAAGGGGNIDPGPQGNRWTGAYGEPRPYGSGVHEGVDIPLAVGVEIKAVMDGVVSFSGMGSGALSRGLYITIDHGGGRTTLYSHLSKSFVSKGNVVMKGDVIGLSGNSGLSTGPHLHFGLYINGKHQNPNGLVGLAYGGGGNKRQYSAASGVTESDLNSGMTSGDTSASGSVVNNFVAGISGVSSTGGSAKQILESILGSPGGSLGASPTTSSSTSLPEPIRAPSSSGMMGETNLGSSTSMTGSESAVGGGYDLGGTNGVDYGSNAINLSKKSTRSNSGLAANVTINLSIAQASESEAKKFVGMIKDMLEEEKLIGRMGSK